MTNLFPKTAIKDNGGRRSGTDRREYSYSAHLPERRSGLDQRSGFDRRRPLGAVKAIERRSGKERRQAWPGFTE
jgi:hypothetical protein